MTNLKFKVREENRKAETGKLISGHLNSAEMLDTLIKDNLSSQADNIKSRLEMRRNLSFQKCKILAFIELKLVTNLVSRHE